MFAIEEPAPVAVRSRTSGPPEVPGEVPGPLDVLAARVRPTTASRTRLLPVHPPLVPLLPDGGLRRGSVVHCAGGGALSLVLAVVGEASAAGSWCGTVGVDDLGALAAAGYGVDLHRLAVVRTAPAHWVPAAGCLLDGLDLVVVQPPGRARLRAARQLVARARRRGAVLLVLGPASCWPEPVDVLLRAGGGRWDGLDRGAGHLGPRRVAVEAHGRGMASRPVRRELWLPTATGGVG